MFVYKYSLKATLKLALSLLRVVRLHGTVENICSRIKCTFFGGGWGEQVGIWSIKMVLI